MATVDLKTLHALFANMEGRVAYKLGAKAPSLTCDSHLIHEIDCSGFSRYALSRATNGALIIPDGSVQQREYFQKIAALKAPYNRDELIHGLHIAFMDPFDGHGHVWLVYDGQTMESHGGKGVDSRWWNASVLLNNVDYCFKLPSD